MVAIHHLSFSSVYATATSLCKTALICSWLHDTSTTWLHVCHFWPRLTNHMATAPLIVSSALDHSTPKLTVIGYEAVTFPSQAWETFLGQPPNFSAEGFILAAASSITTVAPLCALSTGKPIIAAWCELHHYWKSQDVVGDTGFKPSVFYEMQEFTWSW